MGHIKTKKERINMLKPYNLNLETTEQTNSEIWVDIYAAHQNNTIINGFISGIEEHDIGGKVGKALALVVMFDNIKGLIPQQECGILRYPTDENGNKKDVLSKQERALVKAQLKSFVGLTEPVTILDIHRDDDIVILSREKAIEQLAKITWQRLSANKIVTAKVRSVGKRRVVLDIGGITVSMPCEELSWGFINDASMIVVPGDEISVKILEFDREKQHIKVSHRETTPNPWPECVKKYKRGNFYMGKVSGVIEQAVFVNLEPGVDVYCKHLAFERVKPGDQVVVKITGIDLEAKRVWGSLAGRRNR